MRTIRRVGRIENRYGMVTVAGESLERLIAQAFGLQDMQGEFFEGEVEILIVPNKEVKPVERAQCYTCRKDFAIWEMHKLPRKNTSRYYNWYCGEHWEEAKNAYDIEAKSREEN